MYKLTIFEGVVEKCCYATESMTDIRYCLKSYKQFNNGMI